MQTACFLSEQELLPLHTDLNTPLLEQDWCQTAFCLSEIERSLLQLCWLLDIRQRGLGSAPDLTLLTCTVRLWLKPASEPGARTWHATVSWMSPDTFLTSTAGCRQVWDVNSQSPFFCTIVSGFYEGGKMHHQLIPFKLTCSYVPLSYTAVA